MDGKQATVKSYLKTHKNNMKGKGQNSLNHQKGACKGVSGEGQRSSVVKNVIKNPATLNRRAFVDDLPDEILYEVFSYLEIQDLVSVSQVCSRWHGISNDNALWRPILMKYAFGMADGMIDEVTNTNTKSGVKHLCMKRCVTLRNKWILCNKALKKRHPYTYTSPTSEVEKLARLAGVSWQLVLFDHSDREHILYTHDTTWHHMTVTLRWFSLEGISLGNVKEARLHACNPVFFDHSKKQAVPNGPFQRSLLLAFDLNWRSWVEKNKPIGSDDLINVYSLPSGVMVTTWRSDGELAFLSLALPVHKLMQRCLKGTMSQPYYVTEKKFPTDDVDPTYGLHGYMCTIQLRTMKTSIWDQQFRGLDCKREDLVAGSAIYTLIHPHERQIIDKDILLPWKTDAFRGKVKNVCWCDITMADETGDIFWIASAPVNLKSNLKQATSNLDFDYEYNETQYLELVDEMGRFHMEIAKTDRKDSYITQARLQLSLSAINSKFGTKYR